jgi:hypothetical protein
MVRGGCMADQGLMEINLRLTAGGILKGITNRPRGARHVDLEMAGPTGRRQTVRKPLHDHREMN